VKEKISKEKGWEASQQKLIYSGNVSTLGRQAPSLTDNLGKILQDANTVESYKIEEKGFIVCMISKVCHRVFAMVLFKI
jgi:UV excision repair protein RAD23